MKKVYALALGLVVAHAALTLLGGASITLMLAEMRDGIRAMVAREPGSEIMLVLPFGFTCIGLVGLVLTGTMALAQWQEERGVPFKHAILAAITYTASLCAGLYLADTAWTSDLPALGWYALPMLGAAVVQMTLRASEPKSKKTKSKKKGETFAAA